MNTIRTETLWILVLCCGVLVSGNRSFAQPSPVMIGSPTRYMIDVQRYRFDWPNVQNTAFYPIPQDRVDRAAYMKSINAMQPERIAENPNRGMDGPRAFMPVLAKFVETSEPKWADACRKMLDAFHIEMQQQVAQHKWFWQFEHPAALIPLYRKYLMEGGQLDQDDQRFRDMWLYYCRNLHVWDSEPTEWRGGCHRSMPEAYAKGLAAQWYPGIPEVEQWQHYSQLVFHDFWKTKDVPQNDTGYMMGPLIILICGGDQWTGNDQVYQHPEIKRLWDRLAVEVGPDGLINPYGPNGGWNSTADYRVAMLERLAAKTKNGEYRFAAHKLFNYLRYQSPTLDSHSYQMDEGSGWLIALAYLFADDSVTPVKPTDQSLWTKRTEAIRIPHTDKTLTERLLGNADARENFGHICCSWYMTGKQWPDKLILRSGWNAGDLFALVELHPTSFPANPGGIMGLNRWAAPFTQIVTSKGASVENRLMIEDVNQQAKRQLHPDKLRI
ncbi:MAG: hypothetical protein KDA87_26215, partial [Planctomycetales bacterium]|nr:hypothetical protein [Planctomycetales bacterium]